MKWGSDKILTDVNRNSDFEHYISKELGLKTQLEWVKLHDRVVAFIRNDRGIRNENSEECVEVAAKFSQLFSGNGNGIRNFNWKKDTNKLFDSVGNFLDQYDISKVNLLDSEVQTKNLNIYLSEIERTIEEKINWIGVIDVFLEKQKKDYNEKKLFDSLKKAMNSHLNLAIIFFVLGALGVFLIGLFFIKFNVGHNFVNLLRCLINETCVDSLNDSNWLGLLLFGVGIPLIRVCITEYRKQMHNYLKYDFSYRSIKTANELVILSAEDGNSDDYYNDMQKLKEKIILNAFSNLDTGYANNPTQPGGNINIPFVGGEK